MQDGIKHLNDRVKFNCRKDGDRVVIDLKFDDCPLQTVIVTAGDVRIAADVADGVAFLTERSKLVYADGEPYQYAKGHPRNVERTMNILGEW